MVNSLKVRAIKSLINQGYTFDPTNKNIALTNNERQHLYLYFRQRPEYKLHMLQRIMRLNKNIMPNKNRLAEEVFKSMNLKTDGPKAKKILAVIKNSNGVKRALEIYYSRRRHEFFNIVSV
jgi:hypothetical protein